MKKYLFLLLTFAGILATTNINAQSLLYTGEMGPDTLNASETIYQYPNGTSVSTSRRFTALGALEILVRVDSLSGATGGTMTLQTCNDLNCDEWYDAGTLTINGSTTQYYRFEDTLFVPTRFRLKYVAPGGTQATKVKATYSFKKTL